MQIVCIHQYKISHNILAYLFLDAAVFENNREIEIEIGREKERKREMRKKCEILDQENC